jgi:WD40-like Beta Propeller Repeat
MQTVSGSQAAPARGPNRVPHSEEQSIHVRLAKAPRADRSPPPVRASKSVRHALPASLVLAVVLSACSGGEEDRATSTTTAPIPPIRKTPEPSGGPLPGRVVFHDRNGDLWTMRGDESERRQLTRSGESFDLDPVWSPDGELVVFRSSRDPSPYEGLLVIRADGTGERVFASGGTFADWSPDGRHVVFSATGAARISIADRDGSYVRALGPDGECSTWSPTGELIAFCKLDGDNWDAWVVSADGRGERRLTDDPGGEYPQGWSPDGQQVVLWNQGDGLSERLTVAALDGSAPWPLTGLASRHESFGAWLPDGSILVGIDHPGRGMKGWYLMRPGRPRFVAVLPSLRRICCGEGQLDWLP